MQTIIFQRAALLAAALAAAALTASCGGGGDATASASAAAAQATVPVTPDVADLTSTVVDGVRVFQLQAQVFEQQLETFPYHTAQVWGYNGSTPGPTAIAYEGEKLRFVIKNELPDGTTLHFHGVHAPADADGVAGISQPVPIAPGATYTYEFTPAHSGTFAYHSHTDDAKQEMKGLDGILIVLPKTEAASDHVDRDYALALQEFFITGEGQPVDTAPPGGEFNTFTINGKTRDAASELPARVGEKVRLRLYNASNGVHSMHLHDFDMTIVSQNGHDRPLDAQFKVTTVDIGPGNFYDVEFTPDKPGKWVFHCHFPHHTSNSMMSGPDGSPEGMTRVFNVTS